MDKRSWPWKKKSSDKQAKEKANASASDSSAIASDIGATQIDKGKMDNNNKKSKYVQISIESHTHLTGLEDQMKSYEEQVQSLKAEAKELNEKLSEAHSEMTNKDNVVKQHAKVAEEAVSGWEKAEAEAATLKNHVESFTLLKLNAEDRASHLDGALKECMRQIRNLKEEHDLKLNEVVLNKNKLFDKMKLELEGQVANLEQELLRSAAESAALSRTLQERSNMLVKLSEEKLQAEAQIELLKSNIWSCEKEVNSLKYELHIARKEVEIRNEEKNMSVRAAEVANKQHIDGAKKIAKLEAECQRLRGLVRKKLPGPAALAQMKLEVENIGRDYGDFRLRRSSARTPTTHLSQLSEFSPDNSLKYQKENEQLTERLLAMDEETRMLKEALAQRNGELHTSRSICSETTSKVQSLGAQLKANIEWRSPATNGPIQIEGFPGERACNLLSYASTSVDVNDDNVSCAGSCATVTLSDFSYIQRDKNADTPNKYENNHHLNLMDDFLEMEKLAYRSLESNGTFSSSDVSDITGNTGPEFVKHGAPVEVTMSSDPLCRDQHALQPQVPLKTDITVAIPPLEADPLIFVKLQTKISRVLNSLSEEKDMGKVRNFIQDMFDTLHCQSQGDSVEAAHSSVTVSNCPTLTDDAKISLSLSEDVNSCTDNVKTVNKELEIAISNIYNFVTNLSKEAKFVPEASPDEDGLSKSINMFTATYNEATKGEINLVDFVLDISHVLSKASELQLGVSESENSNSDCIDKVALPENKAVVDLSGERYANGCSLFSDSASDPDIPGDGNLVPTSESTATSWKCSLEELEKLKMDKDNLAIDLARCTERFENTKSQLLETEQLLADVKSQLTSAQRSNSLAETQLKCMAESYKSLETRAEELQSEVNLRQGKIENLDNELQEERRNHQDAVTRCNDLLEQLQRIDSHAAADNHEKTSQDMELAAAAEKLVECQETIFLLAKQLKALGPRTDSISFLNKRSSQKIEELMEDEWTINGTNLQNLHSSEMYTSSSFNLHGAGSEPSLDLSDAQLSPSDTEANNPLRSPVLSNYPKHRHTKSSLPSSSSTPTPEKQTRGLSRFFSSKGKNAA